MIKRFIENTVIKSAKAFPVIVITGPRQIGKSTLLDMLKKEKKIIANNHISLKDTVLRDFARNDPKGFLNTYKYPIIIDEIQEAPELFNEIKTIVDKKRLEDKNKSYGMYFLSGSQKFKLMKGVKESLAGMSAILDMMPISNNELKDGSHLPFLPTNNFKDKREQESLINIYQKIYRGFFPEVVNNKNIDSSIYYSSYIKTVIERDVNEIIKLDDTNKFRHFVETIAIRTGQELIINELAKDNDINNETVTRWLSVLQTLGLINLIQPYYSSEFKKIVKRARIYFVDTGLAAHLSKIPSAESLQLSIFAGSFFETYVVNEIIKSYANNGKDISMYFNWLRTAQNQRKIEHEKHDKIREIDFIINLGSELYPIEIKTTSSPSIYHFKNFSIFETQNKKVKIQTLICLYPEILKYSNNKIIIPEKFI